MKPIREIKSATEIRQFFLNPVDGGTKVNMGGKHYYMLTVDRGFSEQGIKRRKQPKGAFKVNEKTCMNCKLTKSVDKHFYTSTNSKDGYGGMCKECVKVLGKAYGEKKKEERNEETKRQIDKMMFDLARDSNLIPHDLTIQEWKIQMKEWMEENSEEQSHYNMSLKELLDYFEDTTEEKDK